MHLGTVRQRVIDGSVSIWLNAVPLMPFDQCLVLVARAVAIGLDNCCAIARELFRFRLGKRIVTFEALHLCAQASRAPLYRYAVALCIQPYRLFKSLQLNLLP